MASRLQSGFVPTHQGGDEAVRLFRLAGNARRPGDVAPQSMTRANELTLDGTSIAIESLDGEVTRWDVRELEDIR